MDHLLALHPPVASALEAMLRSPVTMSADERSARLGLSAARPSSRTASTLVLPVRGPLSHHGSFLTLLLGGTSYDAITAALRAAVADPNITNVVMAFDTPGGGVIGLEETAAEIRAARKVKPVIGVVDGMAASAGYWLAAQTSPLIASPSSLVGSLGVVAVVVDSSALEERLGIRTHAITTSKYKGEGIPGTPVTDEVREAMRQLALGFHRRFVADVATGRRTTEATVEAKFGEGRVVAAREALKLGMVDRLATFNDVLGELTRDARRDADFARAQATYESRMAWWLEMTAKGLPCERPEPPQSDEAAELRLKLATMGL